MIHETHFFPIVTKKRLIITQKKCFVGDVKRNQYLLSITFINTGPLYTILDLYFITIEFCNFIPTVLWAFWGPQISLIPPLLLIIKSLVGVVTAKNTIVNDSYFTISEVTTGNKETTST